MKLLLSGNEAIALGAYLAGISVATAYPGTPSTEILAAFERGGWLDRLLREAGQGPHEVHAEWSTNEKVALEVAVGAAWGGVRAMTSMKQVGLNVAADPLFTSAVTGVNGGLVLVSADDPGLHSSATEQDSRNYARAAKVPILEPADSQECLDLMREAFALSERFDTPVLVRTTTRISHSKSPVEFDLAARQVPPVKLFDKTNVRKHVILPAHARVRHGLMVQRIAALSEYAETAALNQLIAGEDQPPTLGFIAGGIAYQHAREAFPNAPFLKLGMHWPLPPKLIADFSRRVERVVVVEEQDPFLETEIRAMGIPVIGKAFFASVGEYSPQLIREGVSKALGLAYERPPSYLTTVPLPPRPPVLCPGCGHRAVFWVLAKLKATVFGDIGCYTLGMFPPLNATHTCLCMGAGLTTSLGYEWTPSATPEERRVAVIGDSTFLHSGVTGLMDAVYNRRANTLIILDNSTTAMTGHQPNPATGRTVLGEQSRPVNLEALCRAVGVEDVQVLNPLQPREFERGLRDALAHPMTSVIIARYPCIFVDPAIKDRLPLEVDLAKCTACGVCFRTGCPALAKLPDGKATVDPSLCNGCELCLKLCPKQAFTISDLRLPIGD